MKQFGQDDKTQLPPWFDELTPDQQSNAAKPPVVISCPSCGHEFNHTWEYACPKCKWEITTFKGIPIRFDESLNEYVDRNGMEIPR